MERLKWEDENWDWLELSSHIAFQLCDFIHKSKMDKTEVCLRLNVSRGYLSRLMKGQENLTLQTIAKLERLTKRKLIFIMPEEPQKKVIIAPKRVHVVPEKVIQNKKPEKTPKKEQKS